MLSHRLIAIDLDGTFLSPDGKVTARVKAAVQRTAAAGHLVCFATGRSWTESRQAIDAAEHYGPAVFVGGAMVIDTSARLTLQRSLMSPELAREISGALESLGQTVLALQDVETAGTDYLVGGAIELIAATADWMRITVAAMQRVPSLALHPHDHTLRIGIVAPTAECRLIRQELLRRFDGRIICHSLAVPAYGVEVLEVFDPAVNKWEGILHIARRHGMTGEQVIAIGDDVNDVVMIANAGLGVAMGNARPEVLAVADRVIGSNADEGLAKFLEELAG